MPVLLVAGELDAKFAVKATRLAEAIGPNASVELVPEAGHAVPFERPQAFAGLVATFLGG
jgi:pimeloyl-ACP methyl ester carboxylesterase